MRKSVSAALVAAAILYCFGFSGGPARAQTTCTGVSVKPGVSLAQKIKERPAGTTFCLASGTYFVPAVLKPKDGQKFIGSGAVLIGSKVVAPWVHLSTSWVASEQTAQSNPSGTCVIGTTTCQFHEDVFLNGARLKRVLSLTEIGPGKFYFDYTADKIYIGSDPTGKTARVAVSPGAFGGTADNVTISGLTVTQFANPAGPFAAISAREGTGWKILDVTATNNHARGIGTGPGAQVLDSTANYNGQLGIGGTATGGLIRGNQVLRNNALNFRPGIEGGGIKLGATLNAIISNNVVSDNLGAGIWCDMNCKGVTIEGNTVRRNSTQGIHYEISYDGIIRNNISTDNGYDKVDSGLYGANILVVASGSSEGSTAGVKVYGNTVSGGTNGIGLIQGDRSDWPEPYGPHITKDVYVHHNTIKMTTGATGGSDATGTLLFTSRNNRFDYNTYYLSNLSGQNFRWMNNKRTKEEWRALGQDKNGTFSKL